MPAKHISLNDLRNKIISQARKRNRISSQINDLMRVLIQRTKRRLQPPRKEPCR